MASDDRILGAGRRLFGYRSLRPGQREAIESVLEGRDTLAVLATGSGKSAIYELAGPLRSGTTVVISPLIALQRDQLAALEAAGHLVAVALNSQEPAKQRRQALEQLGRGGRHPDFVFLAPEQLANPDVLERLGTLRPVLVAVDEAHLVSQWGPDFRPDYLRIRGAVDVLGRPVVLALTATASPHVRDEIIDRLGMQQPKVLVRGFGRDNIHLSVHSYFTDDRHKLEVVTDDVTGAVGTLGHGIVYGATHDRVERLAATLSDRGLRAAAYHAGLDNQARRGVERRFHEDELEVVVATIAFGMGVDKPDIRWVFHVDVPGSIDEYYQEVGRAGRDGNPAQGVLYFRAADLALPRRYAARAGPSRATIAAVAASLTARRAPATLADLQAEVQLSRDRAEAAVMTLADAGAVTLQAGGTITVTADVLGAVTRAAELVSRRREVERDRVAAMEAYAGNFGCRWQFLLEYLGEPAPTRCGHCDSDERAAGDDGPRRRPFPRGSRVAHRVFGEGTVIGYVGKRIVVDFDAKGFRRLDLEVVMARTLLVAVDDGNEEA